MSSLAQLNVEIQRLTAERNALEARYIAGDQALKPEIDSLSQQIQNLYSQINVLRGSDSAGEVISQAQQAKDSGSTVTAPAAANGRIISPGNPANPGSIESLPYYINDQGQKVRVLDISRNTDDAGTAETTRPLTETQGTAPGSNQTSSGPTPINAAPQPGGQPGVGAPSDDQGTVTDVGEIVITDERPRGNTNATVSELNSVNFTKQLIPKPNILDKYASYTYQASLYLMTKESYQNMVSTGNKNLSNAKLLVQSGGATPGTRNDYFNLDYYIDSLELKSFIAGKSVKLAHNVSEVKMTIVEPNGISFIRNLDAAVQQFLGGRQNAKRNFTSQIYLLVIRFYGYDDQGNLVRGGVASPDQTSDPNSFVEKWYPLIISKVNFRVASKAVEYEIEAKAPPYAIAASQGRGTIPFNIELSGQTLKELLAGPATYTTGLSAAAAADARAAAAATDSRRLDLTAPAKANAAQSNKQTVRSGLMSALNEYQQKLVKEGKVQVPDEYEIEFALDSLASATVLNTGLNIGATSMAKPGTAGDQKLPSKQSMDPKSRVESATAGMQIAHFIDMLVRNSSYIKEQQTVVINEKNNEAKPTGININNTAWYKISFQAQAKLDQYDEKRNGYAYKIKYIVSPYKISQLNSPYFKAPTFNGVHKQYRYWFTGENTQVISYEESLNALYYIVLTGGNLGNATSSVNSFTNNVSELLQYQPQTASGQSTQGADGRTLEPAANAADQLYSPSDLKEANVTIVGDPAWLQQGEAFNGIPKGAPYAFEAFLPDGTINFDSQQVLFEVGYNAPADYSLGTGLIESARGVTNSLLSQEAQTTRPTYGGTQESRIYIAKEVRSHFAKGKFTQDLKGSLMIYYPNKTDQGRPPPQNIPTASQQAATTVLGPPAWNPKLERSSVTNPTPSSALAKGVQQILTPATQLDNPTLSQLQASPVYIQARRGGATPAAALDAARASFAAGTNNAANFAAPGIRTGPQLIVKDQ
jgi:hypothetical protein